MADCYVQGSFAFTCTDAEMALIEEAFQASYDLEAGDTPGDPTQEFLTVFPPLEANDPWSGFVAIFPDPDFPNFGVDFEGGNTLDRPDVSTVHFYSTTDFQPDALAHLIRHCCQETLRQAPIGFEWACSCSRPRVGEFGGGACVIFADRVVFETTRAMLERVLAGASDASASRETDDVWGQDPDHPLADWRTEVANDDTRLGYWRWVAARRA